MPTKNSSLTSKTKKAIHNLSLIQEQENIPTEENTPSQKTKENDLLNEYKIIIEKLKLIFEKIAYHISHQFKEQIDSYKKELNSMIENVQHTISTIKPFFEKLIDKIHHQEGDFKYFINIYKLYAEIASLYSILFARKKIAQAQSLPKWG